LGQHERRKKMIARNITQTPDGHTYAHTCRHSHHTHIKYTHIQYTHNTHTSYTHTIHTHIQYIHTYNTHTQSNDDCPSHWYAPLWTTAPPKPHHTHIHTHLQGHFPSRCRLCGATMQTSRHVLLVLDRRLRSHPRIGRCG